MYKSPIKQMSFYYDNCKVKIFNSFIGCPGNVIWKNQIILTKINRNSIFFFTEK